MNSPDLDILAVATERIRTQVRELRYAAAAHLLGDSLSCATTLGYCHAVDLLLGQIGAAFSNEAQRQRDAKLRASKLADEVADRSNPEAKP